jgi:hypothetical protein
LNGQYLPGSDWVSNFGLGFDQALLANLQNNFKWLFPEILAQSGSGLFYLEKNPSPTFWLWLWPIPSLMDMSIYLPDLPGSQVVMLLTFYFQSTTDFTSLCGNCSESYYNTRKFFWETLVPNSKGSDYGSVCIDLKDAVNILLSFWYLLMSFRYLLMSFDVLALQDSSKMSIYIRFQKI